MKKRLQGFLMLFLALVVQVSFAQTTTVTGTITDGNNLPLPGVNVIIQGSTNGTQTDFDGNYTITGSVGDIIMYSYVGFTPTERTISAATSTIDIVLQAGETLDEVVVTGVAGATSRKKLSVTVNKVSAEAIEQVPATSAASALQGKVAGVAVNNLGRPGQGANIILRGSTNFYGSQEPLIILDGVFVEGGLSDINVQDIKSFEIVKGASASSLYGSRAGNGVIVITTKNGQLGRTDITVRSEIGFNEITNFVATNQSHGYQLAADWEDFKGQYTKYEGVTYPSGYQSVYAASGHPTAPTGARIPEDDGYSDNPYGVYRNFQDMFFKTGTQKNFYTSIANGGEKANVFFSFENLDSEGVLVETEGYLRSSYRLNADYKLFDWLKFSTNNNFIKIQDNSPGGSADIYRIINRLSPDSNVMLDNPDGQPYYFKPDPWENEINNPLYQLYVADREALQQRFLGSYNLNAKFTSWLNLDLEYAFESDNYRYTDYNKYETFQADGSSIGFGYSKGSLYKFSSNQLSQKLQSTLNFSESFGELDVNAKVSYLAEDRTYENFTGSGSDFLYRDLPSLDNFDPSTISVSSDSQIERAQNIFFIGGLIFKDRYIVDALYRKDGSSLFGANYKWRDYHRFSAAYRISEDLEIPGINEMKINAAYGTAGQRPGFSWQYEQTALSGGSLSTNRIAGNPDLRPSTTTEKELGLSMAFLDSKITLEAVYSNQVTTDQFMLVSLFAPANAGKNRQWQNVGDLEADTYELAINANIINNTDFQWSLGANFAKSTNNITKLNAPEQQVGPDALFLLRENTEFGSMWGRVFVQDLETMESQLPTGASIADYSVNSDGYVVETATIGTQDEAAIIKVDENGTPVFEQIGNQNPDFRVGLTSNLSYKNFSLYMLWDWKQGGDIYNRNRQWLTISERTDIVDQAGKPENEKKTIKYYGSLYDVNQNNGYWVENGTFVKLRELSLSYNFPQKTLDKLGFLNQLKLSLIGRNLLTFTEYNGWDPEVQNYSSDTQQYFSVDYGVYPTQTTYSFAVQVKF